MDSVSTLFETGGSLALRIPKRMAPKTRRVTIKKVGDSLVITPVLTPQTWVEYAAQCKPVSEDFMTKREPLSHSKREWD